MLNLFKGADHPLKGVRRPYEFNYVRAGYLRELLVLQDYYKTRVFSVKGTNFLVRLLRNMSGNLTYPNDIFLESARARVSFLATHFKMTSEVSKGYVHPGYFYGSGNSEVYLFNDDFFSADYVEKNWKDVSAITVVSHAIDDFKLLLPNGKETGSSTGVAIISINMLMLNFQYRCFLKEQDMVLRNGGVPHDVPVFVGKYLLPNMMNSHSDQVVFNRLYNLHFGIKNTTPKFKHPFNLTSYEDKLDHTLEQTLDVIRNSGMRYYDMLNNMPGITDISALNVNVLPEYAPTVNIRWALFLARVKQIYFLIDVGGERSIRNNRELINDLKLYIKRLERDNLISDKLSWVENKKIQGYLDYFAAL